MKQEFNNCPPIICILSVNNMLYGSFDIPQTLENAIDKTIGKKLYNKKDLKDFEIELFFTLLNDETNEYCIFYDKKSIEKREDIKKIFDQVVETFQEEFIRRQMIKQIGSDYV